MCGALHGKLNKDNKKKPCFNYFSNNALFCAN